jgi:hypothetical protein
MRVRENNFLSSFFEKKTPLDVFFDFAKAVQRNQFDSPLFAQKYQVCLSYTVEAA